MHGSHYAILKYEDFRKLPDPHVALLGFLESSYQAGATLATWPIHALRHQYV